MSKRFTIIVPAALWPLACLIVAARGEVGRGMLNVRHVDANGNVFYACSAGGALDDPGTYNRFSDPWSLWEYLQTVNEQPLPFAVEDIITVLSEATIIEHPDGEIVTDAIFAGLGLEIVEIVTEFPEAA